jgi:hypothetical protein
MGHPTPGDDDLLALHIRADVPSRVCDGFVVAVEASFNPYGTARRHGRQTQGIKYLSILQA